MRYLAFILAAITSAEMQAFQLAPRLVVNVTIDQLRTDYMEAFSPLYTSNGFRRLLRDGLEISQNRELLYLASMAYVGASATTHVPELVNDRWFDRADITLTFRREIVREYPVLHFLSANGLIYTETITPQITWQVAPEA